MNIITCKNVSKAFVDHVIFKDMNLEIKKNEKIGLVGRNGTGKSTIANLILQNELPENGHIERFIELDEILYFKQSSETSNISDDFSSLYDLQKRIGLNKISESEWSFLSSGQKSKLALTHIFSSKAEFIILDEPTNHLDFVGIEWLIEQINHFKGTILIISHDRFFLDKTVSRILDIEDNKVKSYTGNYSSFQEKKQKLRDEQQKHYDKQQKHISKIENQIAQFKAWSEKSHRTAGKSGTASENRQIGLKEYERAQAKKKDQQIKSKLNRLNLELEKNKVDKPSDDIGVNFHFEDAAKKGKNLLEAKQISKVFEHTTVFNPSDFFINFGEKVGIIGENGCGKTTLIKMILGEENTSTGALWRSPGLKIGYLSQDVSDLNPDNTIIKEMNSCTPEELERFRYLLVKLALDKKTYDKKIAELSYGEKMKLKFAKILLTPYDVLILDEPTNHLDLAFRETLEDTLSIFQGTLLVVSHDRYFVDKICDKLLVFEDKKIKKHNFKLEEYLFRKHNPQNLDVTDGKEKLMVLENQLNQIIGRLSLIDSKHPTYLELDNEYKELLKKIKELK